MSLETALQSLQSRVTDLQRAVSELTPFITDVRVPVPLVDDIDNVVAELTGTADEAAAAVAAAICASEPDGSLEGVFTALGEVHAALNRCAASYVGLFVPAIPGHDSLVDKLLERGHRYGRQWLRWSRVVRRSIGLCSTPIGSSANALAECWQELTVRLARHSVSVHATNIGQQITVRDEQRPLAVRAT